MKGLLWLTGSTSFFPLLQNLLYNHSFSPSSAFPEWKNRSRHVMSRSIIHLDQRIVLCRFHSSLTSSFLSLFDWSSCSLSVPAMLCQCSPDNGKTMPTSGVMAAVVSNSLVNQQQVLTFFLFFIHHHSFDPFFGFRFPSVSFFLRPFQH